MKTIDFHTASIWYQRMSVVCRPVICSYLAMSSPRRKKPGWRVTGDGSIMPRSGSSGSDHTAHR